MWKWPSGNQCAFAVRRDTTIKRDRHTTTPRLGMQAKRIALNVSCSTVAAGDQSAESLAGAFIVHLRVNLNHDFWRVQRASAGTRPARSPDCNLVAKAPCSFPDGVPLSDHSFDLRD